MSTYLTAADITANLSEVFACEYKKARNKFYGSYSLAIFKIKPKIKNVNHCEVYIEIIKANYGAGSKELPFEIHETEFFEDKNEINVLLKVRYCGEYILCLKLIAELASGELKKFPDYTLPFNVQSHYNQLQNTPFPKFTSIYYDTINLVVSKCQDAAQWIDTSKQTFKIIDKNKFIEYCINKILQNKPFLQLESIKRSLRYYYKKVDDNIYILSTRDRSSVSEQSPFDDPLNFHIYETLNANEKSTGISNAVVSNAPSPVNFAREAMIEIIKKKNQEISQLEITLETLKTERKKYL